MDRRPLFVGALVAALLGSGVGPAATPAFASHSTAARLPDLVMLPPGDFRIEQKGRGKRWLRFSTVIVNVGPGAFQVYGYPAQTSNGDPYGVVQQVEEADGTFSNHPTDATIFWSGDGHNHYHVRDLQEMTLQNLNAVVLARGAKRGFCFWDNYDYEATSGVYYHPSTTDACELTGGGTIPMGLSVGWGDRYPYNIAFQYIDISQLGNGDYLVEVTADPALTPGGLFVEADELNNTAWAKIRIKRKTVTVLEVSPLP